MKSLLGCVEVFDSGSVPFLLPNDIERLRNARSHSLPPNYNFEIAKTLRKIWTVKAKRILLQLPEGLLIFATAISDLLEEFSPTENLHVIILADPTYGACCIDDFSAESLGADLLIHYGHSCLVPVQASGIPLLYIFVEIAFSAAHFTETIKMNFPIKHHLEDEQVSKSAALTENEPVKIEQESKNEKEDDKLFRYEDILEPKQSGNESKPAHINSDSMIPSYSGSPKIALLGTIQYSAVLHKAKIALQEFYGSENVIVPQESPLTSGEVLGCTSPVILHRQPSCQCDSENRKKTENHPEGISSCGCSTGPNKFEVQTNGVDFAIFLSDGRFHVESALIRNPTLPFFKYDPFTKRLTRERCSHSILHRNRQRAISDAQNCSFVYLILSTLGRQGSVGILSSIKKILEDKNIPHAVVLMSEILPENLSAFIPANRDMSAHTATSNSVCFVQIGCPRLSVDWGHQFKQPLLNAYEACVAFGDHKYLDTYPMNYYSRNSTDRWGNFSPANFQKKQTSLKARWDVVKNEIHK